MNSPCSEGVRPFPGLGFVLVAVVSLFFPQFLGLLGVRILEPQLQIRSWWLGLYAGLGLLFLILQVPVYRQNAIMFGAQSFFTLLFISYPLIVLQTRWLKLYFPGVMYLIPLLAFFLLRIVFQGLRRRGFRVPWLAIGSLDPFSLLLIAGLLVVSALGLVLWVRLLKPDLSLYLGWVPDLPFLLIIPTALGFAFTNAVVEEVIHRGALYDGLHSFLKDPRWVIALQALGFGLWHYGGFPRGPVGLVMVVAWGICLGYLRRRSRGLLAPVLAHIGADLTIFLFCMP